MYCARSASGRNTSGLYNNLIINIPHLAFDIVAAVQAVVGQLLEGEDGGGSFFASRVFSVRGGKDRRVFLGSDDAQVAGMFLQVTADRLLVPFYKCIGLFTIRV